MPVVSVIIPTYQRPNYLKEAIESVISQTYSDWELLVVDDGSPIDNIRGVTQHFCDRDARVRYIRQAHAGVCEARNTGIRFAQGKYVAFLDDDDRWTAEKLERQVAYMEGHPEIGLVYARTQFYRKGDGLMEKSTCLPLSLERTF